MLGLALAAASESGRPAAVVVRKKVRRVMWSPVLPLRQQCFGANSRGQGARPVELPVRRAVCPFVSFNGRQQHPVQQAGNSSLKHLRLRPKLFTVANAELQAKR